MSNILFLTQRMRLGFGVSVLVHELSRELLKLGHQVTVGCEDTDYSFKSYPILIVKPELEDIRRLTKSIDRPVIIAQTSPFYELTAQLGDGFEVWAWENGDPT